MKSLFISLLTAVVLVSCSKNDKESTPVTPPLAKGDITYDLDGVNESGAGGAYNFADTAYFVKHESGQSQLSINFNDNKAGSLSVGTTNFEKGKAFISFFPDFNAEQYSSVSGQVSIEKIEGLLISGTFSGTLARQSDSKSIMITNGRFNQIWAPKI